MWHFSSLELDNECNSDYKMNERTVSKQSVNELEFLSQVMVWFLKTSWSYVM